MIDYREIKFGEAIEHYLTTAGGYSKADPGNFNREFALDPTVLLPLICESQPAKWKIIVDYYGSTTHRMNPDAERDYRASPSRARQPAQAAYP